MRQLELLAPARDIQVGIAAIDCGADAVYIAGPQFGARQAAGNSIEDIRQLCTYAHKFGARIFVALNTILYDIELEDAYRQMLAVQEAGADALIIQDMAVLKIAQHGIGNMHEDFRIPLHASTQCAIRTPEHAAFLERLGFSRLILERELSLEQIRAIRKAVTCELEFFVHGALCVCYSGQCYLSEKIAGRSANRGACIQACRSRYDLIDASGRVLVKDRALLSLKDFNLRNRLKDLAEAGITSFKIEGRLKNISYVRNVVRDYSEGLDNIVSENPDRYERGSFGKVSGGFVPDTAKTFNRGYTELYLDGRRGKWAAMEAAKSMGEAVGEVISASKGQIRIRPSKNGITLNNGDGFSYVGKDGSIVGFKGDVCEGMTIRSRNIPNVHIGARLYRNIDIAFEKSMEKNPCCRLIQVGVTFDFSVSGNIWKISAEAVSEDSRSVSCIYELATEQAKDISRMMEIINGQIGKTVSHYRFSVSHINAGNGIPFMSASFLNSIRRDLAEKIDSEPCNIKDILLRCVNSESCHMREKNVPYKANVSNRLSESLYRECGAVNIEQAYELTHRPEAELMRTRYCIRYELGMCPKHHGCKNSGPLFLLNNGQKFAVRFDCASCEMTVSEA